MKKKCFCSTWWVKYFLVVTRTHYFFQTFTETLLRELFYFLLSKDILWGGAKRFFSNLFHTVQCISWMWLCSWKNTKQKQKHIFLQPQLLCNIDSIKQLLQFFFWHWNHYIFTWIKDTNSCFLRIASRPPVRIFNKIYTQHLNGYD